MANIYKVDIKTVNPEGDRLYDSYSGHVVIAESENAAKAICADNAAGEGAAIWYSANVECLGNAFDDIQGAKIVLSDFNAG